MIHSQRNMSAKSNAVQFGLQTEARYLTVLDIFQELTTMDLRLNTTSRLGKVIFALIGAVRHHYFKRADQ